MPTIWRLNIKTGAQKGIDPRMFCISNKILGVGWAVDCEGEINWDNYYKSAMETYYKKGDKGWWPAVNAIKNRMHIKDLCWTRDWSGVYYLGQIVGEWEYRGEQKYRDADVVNIRGCIWKKVGNVDSVPGKVVNSFVPSRTVQVVEDDSVGLYSQFMFNKLSQSDQYVLPAVSADLFSVISSEDCEDIVGVFLQEKGYRMIPSSCKADTAAYEYVLKHVETGNTAVVQVKRGYVDLNVDDYSKLSTEVYLFTSHGKYTGRPSPTVHCLTPSELKAFAYNKRLIMSDQVKTWIEWIESVEKKG
ncbi:MAG: hypothetical protein V1809_05750 [Planctomycetota bacterium]